MLLIVPAALARADEAGMLRLGDQQYATGTISDSPDGRALHWNHPAFTEPFQFPLPSVVSVSYPTTDQPAAAQGQFGLQLVGGGLLYGDLISIDDNTIRLATETFGELALRRQSVQRLFRWRDGEDRLYVGPRDLSEWQAQPADAWNDAGSVLATSHPGASVFGDVRLPPQCSIDVKVGWDDNPNFRLCFGVDADDANALDDFSGFQIEVWGDELVLLREREDTAGVTPIGTIDSVPGYVQLTVLLDQTNHRAMVLGSDGRVAADLDLGGDPDAIAQSGFGFENIRGDSRLEAISVRAGSAEMFDAAEQTDTLVWLDNDESFKGRLQASEDKGRTLVFSEGNETRRVPSEQVARIVLQPLQAVAADDTGDEADADQPPTARLSVVTHRGMRLVGQLKKVEQQKMWLSVEELAEPIAIAIAEIRDFVVLDNHPVETRELKSRVGRLETSDTILQGGFEDGRIDGPASCFVFAPALAQNASPLRRDAVAEMIYRDTTVVTVQNASQHGIVFRGAGMGMRMAGVEGQIVIANGVRRVISPVKKKQKKTDPSKRTLHLRAGDTVECEVLSIDDVGIKVRCKGDIEALVPHAQIRAVELESLSGNPVADERKQRLLTVPRMRRKNPPTHLIVSIDGDYLRGRLQSMNEDTLSIETRLDTQQIPRQYVAQVIWLHEDEILQSDGTAAADDGAEAEEQAAAAGDDTSPPADAVFEGLVQVVRGDGTRLSFVAQQVADGIITGTNEYLGPCSQDIRNVDRLVFGGRIFTQTDNLPFASWRLTHAPDPMVFRDGGSGSPGGGPSGKSSELVGQPAPDFELRLLSGENYRLSDHQGDVIVLDFWASWCGPCMQAMPNVDEMVREFDGQGVQLIAVNLQESEKRIQQALERLKLDTVVAMDETGDIAERYQASAIPQTVVIDRQGQITHLFVGGGARTLEQLRSAITDAIQ
ncbi:TlpA family protein disulfide reductase [Roseimaritima ulvae]|nr:TlpA disulfide reductase family protein [Roseimaritima ulvae]